MEKEERSFPREILDHILAIHGNNQCYECQNYGPEWSSISYGILLCLECAGKHRSLGVQISFVKSVYLDTWSVEQIEFLQQGGNSKLLEFFQAHEVNHLQFEARYESQVASTYRSILRERVQQSLSMRSDSPVPKRSSPIDHLVLEFTFWEGPIGMTLKKDESSRAIVARLVSDGAAQKKGVCVGDIVESIAGQSFLSYEELMDAILLLPRPVQIQFLRPQKIGTPVVEGSDQEFSTLLISGADAPLLNGIYEGLSRLTTYNPTHLTSIIESTSNTPSSISLSYSPPRYASPLPPSPQLSCPPSPCLPLPLESAHKLSDFRVTFHSTPFGMTVSRDTNTHRTAVVSRVISDGQAANVGIKVGDMIIGIENKWIEGYDDFLAKMKNVKQYPVSFVIRRTKTKY